MEGFKHYRIGSFARYLCVTTSFLKHYEDEGLTSVVQQDNGYRYYPFPEAAHILEYMRLHSYGVPLKEMRTAVTGPTETAFENIDRHADELQKKADRLQAIVDEHRRFRKWYEDMAGDASRWEVKKIDPVYFLPHSEGQEFLDDERIYEIFPAWSDSMPLVKTGLYVKKNPKTPGTNDIFWGLCVTESNLRKAGIPVNDAVWKLPSGPAFLYHFCDLFRPTCMKDVRVNRHPAFEKMRELGFRASGDALIAVDMKLEKDGVKRGFGRVVIPMAE
jgi:DNA-binding transcriptional MerR regulator